MYRQRAIFDAQDYGRLCGAYKRKMLHILFLKWYVHEAIMEYFKTQNKQASLTTVGLGGKGLKGLEYVFLVPQAS